MAGVKRIFIAIDISDEARLRAADYIDGLRREFPRLRVGWERPEKLHLTLKFVGDVDAGEIEELSTIVLEAAAANDPYHAELNGTGVFPGVRNPRVLWVGMSGENGATASIASSIETECRKIGLRRENRSFSPHLTIARVREPQNSIALAKRHAGNVFEPVGFDVREIVIYKSELRPTGSIYSKLAVFPLRTV